MHWDRVLSLTAALGAMLGVLGTAAYSDTVSTAKTGNWSSTSSWTPPVVPNNSSGTAYDVTIPSNAFVTLDTSPTINSLALNGILIASPGISPTLTVVHDANINGPLLFGGHYPQPPPEGPGSLAVGGDLNVGQISGQFFLIDGALTVGGNLTNATYATLVSDTGNDPFKVAGTLTNQTGAILQLGQERCFGPGCPIGNANLGLVPAPITTLGTLVNNGQVYSWSGIKAGSIVNNGLTSLIGGGASTTTLKNAGTIDLSNSCCSIAQEQTASLTVGTGTNGGGYTQFANGVLDEVLSGKSTYGTINAGPWQVPHGIGGFALEGYSVNLNGTLDIMLQNGFVPTIGEAFNIITTAPGDISGAFSNVVWDSFDHGFGAFAVTYDNATGNVVLTAETIPEPGTFFLFLPAVAFIFLGVRNRSNSSKPGSVTRPQ